MSFKDRLLRKIVRFLFELSNTDIYFDDAPIDDIKDDYIGFESQVEFLEENINEKPGIICIVARNGSGKSSLMNLLKKKSFVDIRVVNLMNDVNPYNKEDILANIIVSICDNHHKRLVNSRLNSNYKTLQIISSNKAAKASISFSIFLIFVGWLFRKEFYTFNFFNFFPAILNGQYFIEQICSSIFGFGILLFIFFIFLFKFSVKYPYKDEKPSIGKRDYYDALYEFQSDFKNKVIVIEELDRIDDDIESLRSVLNILYSISLEFSCRFIVSITPDQYLELSDSKLRDSNYKYFKSILYLDELRKVDLITIIEKLLDSKRKTWKKHKISFDNSNLLWYLFSEYDNNSIRIIKHSINEAIMNYQKLKLRFSKMNVDINTCIALVYLKNKYKHIYEKSLVYSEDYDSFYLKLILCSGFNPQFISELYREIYNKDAFYHPDDSYKEVLNYIESHSEDYEYISFIEELKRIAPFINGDFNLEMYCFNYPKYSNSFTSLEDNFIHQYVNDSEIEYNSVLFNDVNKLYKCVKYAQDSLNKIQNGRIPKSIIKYPAIVNILYKESIKSSLELYNQLIKPNINSGDIKLLLDGLVEKYTETYNSVVADNASDLVSIINKLDNPNINAIVAIRISIIKNIGNSSQFFEKMYVGNSVPITYEELEEIYKCYSDIFNILVDDIIISIPIDALCLHINNHYDTYNRSVLNSTFIKLSGDKQIYLINHLNKLDFLDGETIDYLLDNIVIDMATSLNLLDKVSMKENDIENKVVSLANTDNFQLLFDWVTKKEINKYNAVKEYLSNIADVESLTKIYMSDSVTFDLSITSKEIIESNKIYTMDYSKISKIYGISATRDLVRNVAKNLNEEEFMKFIQNIHIVAGLRYISLDIKAILNNYSYNNRMKLREIFMSYDKRDISKKENNKKEAE